MRRLLVVCALVLGLASGASAQHDPIHDACLFKLARIETAWHEPGSRKQRLDQIHQAIHAPSICEETPMPQGSSLRALHTWNVGQQWYVDSLNGNDTTGDGSSSLPWQTLQKAHDYLRNTASWVALGSDVAVNIRPTAPYKAASSARFTLETFFSNSARAPAATRYLIWRKDPAYEERPVINNPDGTSTDKIAIITGSSALNSYQIFSGLDIDGEQSGKGTGAGGSMGIYLSGTAANSNTRMEVLDSKIHGFRISTVVLNHHAQGLFTEGGASFLSIDQVEAYDNGGLEAFGTIDQHGFYIQSADVQITNCSIHDQVSGYGIQFYAGGAAVTPRAVVANTTLHNNYASGFLIHGDEDDVVFKNLIITDHDGRGADSYGIEFYPAPSGGASGNVIDNIVYDGNTANRSHTPSGWTIGDETTADPLYVDPASDLNLQEGSPAISYTDTAYSFGYDLDGNVRVAGSEDAGAYEFVESGTPFIHAPMQGGGF